MNIAYPKTKVGLEIIISKYRKRWKERGMSPKKIKRLVTEFRKKYDRANSQNHKEFWQG